MAVGECQSRRNARFELWRSTRLKEALGQPDVFNVSTDFKNSDHNCQKKRVSQLIPIFRETEPNYLKAHLLWPFARRYRNRVFMKQIPMPVRLIMVEVLVIGSPKIVLIKNSKAGCTSAAHMLPVRGFSLRR